MNDFATTLKELRKKNGLSQSALAKILGISTSAVSMYEQGNREPNFEILGRMADLFQVDTDQLLGREQVPKTYVPTTVAPHLDTSGLTKAELRDVKKYIEFIRSKKKK